jgi:hypothetical protein
MPTEKQTDQTINKRAPYSKKAPTRGGARPGGGRPKGSTTKVTLDDLMKNIELAAGQTYGELLAHNYVGAISRSDWNGVRDYDKAFMNKLIAEKVEIDVNSTEDVVATKQAAFTAALAKLNEIASNTK